MNPNLATLYSGSVIRAAFCAVALDLRTGEEINLLDGASEVTFDVAQDGEASDVRTFRGVDATFGTLRGFGDIEEGVATNSPRLSLSLNPPDTTALSILAAASNVGSMLRIFVGAVDTVTGTPYAELEFIGRLDKAQRGLGTRSSLLDLDVSSYYDELFVEDTAIRLNDRQHRSIRPSEAGMAYAIGVNRALPWGLEKGTPGPPLGVGSLTGGGFGPTIMPGSGGTGGGGVVSTGGGRDTEVGTFGRFDT